MANQPDREHEISRSFFSICEDDLADKFGKQKSGMQALLLDRVLSRQARSECRLMQLPAEILGDILGYLGGDKKSLSMLAQVSSDCRQWARSAQFADFVFDYSPAAHSLVAKLLEETSQQSDRVGCRISPRIGVCIRRVVVKAGASWLAKLHPEFCETSHKRLIESIYDPEPRTYVNPMAEVVTREYLAYRESLQAAVSAAMPNLQAITWVDQYAMDDNFLKVLLHSSICYLKLPHINFEEPYRIEPPQALTFLPLRSLHLGINVASSFYRASEGKKQALRMQTDRLSRLLQDTKEGRPEVAEEHQQMDTICEALKDSGDKIDAHGNYRAYACISALYETLLRLCASTLENLYLDHSCEYERGKSLDLGNVPIAFPALRSARLGHAELLESGYSSILKAPLRHLELPYAANWTELGKALAKSEPLRNIETISMPWIRAEFVSNIRAFLRKHTQVKKLHVSEASFDLIDRHIIASLSTGNFTNLTTLSLHWKPAGLTGEDMLHDVTIDESSLAVIGQIQTLEQLRITGGIAVDRRSQWRIDHDALLLHLRGLTKLKTLAYCRDSYGADLDVEEYYQSLRLVGWEEVHRTNMIAQAEEYATEFLSLTWLYLGQLPFAISRSQDSSFVCLPLTKERDSCQTYLDSIFEMGCCVNDC